MQCIHCFVILFWPWLLQILQLYSRKDVEFQATRAQCTADFQVFDGLAQKLEFAFFYRPIEFYFSYCANSSDITPSHIFKKIFGISVSLDSFGVLKPLDLHHSTLADNQPMYLPLPGMLTCKKRGAQSHSTTEQTCSDLQCLCTAQIVPCWFSDSTAASEP